MTRTDVGHLGPCPGCGSVGVAMNGDRVAILVGDRVTLITVHSAKGNEAAVTAAVKRYLDGHDCLFPELAVEWRGLCETVERLAEIYRVRAEDAAVRGVARTAAGPTEAS